MSIQNVLCGSNGVTCSKSLEIIFTSAGGNVNEKVTLTAEQNVEGRNCVEFKYNLTSLID